MKQLTFSSFKEFEKATKQEREFKKLEKRYIRLGYSKEEARMKARYNR